MISLCAPSFACNASFRRLLLLLLLLCSTLQAFFDNTPHGCHGALEVSAGGTVVTGMRRFSAFASVCVVPHNVALGQQRALTVKVTNVEKSGAAIGILPVGHQLQL